MNRRSAISAAAMAAMGWGTAAHAQANHSPIVRVSIGRYPPEKEEVIAAIMNYSGKPLEMAIRALPGLISYYSGIDRKVRALVNVSLWKDTASATQMETLQPMLDQGKVLIELGVTFERPIPNFTTVWTA
jgi:hypothetical protein